MIAATGISDMCLSKATAKAVAIVAARTAPGCSEYLDRPDTVRLGAGEAVETNANLQRGDPWLRHAHPVVTAEDGPAHIVTSEGEALSTPAPPLPVAAGPTIINAGRGTRLPRLHKPRRPAARGGRV